MKNKHDKSGKLKEKQPSKETLEGEIKEAIEEEKEHVEEGQKIAEQQEEVNEIKQETKKTIPEIKVYGKKETPQPATYEKKKPPQTEYIENQEFYVKNEKDFDTIRNTIKEIKAQDPGMAKVDDSEFYEIEPETKKLKLRKMPRDILARLKEQRILLEYYKIL